MLKEWENLYCLNISVFVSNLRDEQSELEAINRYVLLCMLVSKNHY